MHVFTIQIDKLIKKAHGIFQDEKKSIYVIYSLLKLIISKYLIKEFGIEKEQSLSGSEFCGNIALT